MVVDSAFAEPVALPAESCRAACAAPWPVLSSRRETDRLIAHLRSAILCHDDQREHAVVLYSDAGRRYLGEAALEVGNTASLALCPRTILSRGFALGASGMILAHNHPSGDCRPSAADELATRRLVWLGQMVGLVLLDHLIVTSTKVFSMRARGWL
ncbi:MAG: hypothetical protein ABS49_04935 [Erythrobacter sp. SCN 62-14]|nr:MAG: hypothetical protein ABS49_04935 [Erythrobacter sp. SCN 62-14]